MKQGSGRVNGWFAGDPAFMGAEIANAEEIENQHQALVEGLGGSALDPSAL